MSKKTQNKKKGGTPKRTNVIKNVASVATKGAAAVAKVLPVKKGSILSNIGSLAKKVIPVAAKLLPGPAGVVAKTLESTFNANWWFETYPGDGVSTNVPLIEGKVKSTVDYQSGSTIAQFDSYDYRACLVEMIAHDDDHVWYPCFNPTDDMIATYLVPAIRKVINAVPMQSVEAYRKALTYAATMVALREQLRKYKYLAKNVDYWQSNLCDGSFPLLSPEYSAQFDGILQKIEVKISASIRLPHVLLEYISWRFGRVFRTTDAMKAPYVVYDVLPATFTYDQWVQQVDQLMANLTTYAQAVGDIYNAYNSHQQNVYVADKVQKVYDRKEFCLRTNMDVVHPDAAIINADNNVIIADAHVNNPATFMATTMSTTCATRNESPSNDWVPLFPIGEIRVYSSKNVAIGQGDLLYNLLENLSTYGNYVCCNLASVGLGMADTNISHWRRYLALATVAKSVDLYNLGIYVYAAGANVGFDLTAVSMDTALVPDVVIANQQFLAFANLMSEDKKQHYNADVSELYDEVAYFIDEVTPDSTVVKLS